MHNLIIFGGSFDPPHLGHIAIAKTVQKKFHFDKFIILPTKVQVIKGKHLSALEDRLAMLKLAFSNNNFTIDLREAKRSTPSYMVTTLKDFRREFGSDYSISLLIGMDSFLTLPKWHKWTELFNLCNLLVLFRPNVSDKNITYDLQKELKKRKTHNVQDLLNTSHGLVAFHNAGSYAISSTNLHVLMQQGKNFEKFLSPEIYEYIQKNNLYKK